VECAISGAGRLFAGSKQLTFACVAVEEAEGPCACVNLKIRDRQTLVRHLYKTGPPSSVPSCLLPPHVPQHIYLLVSPGGSNTSLSSPNWSTADI